jgi:hypothetical protein
MIISTTIITKLFNTFEYRTCFAFFEKFVNICFAQSQKTSDFAAGKSSSEKVFSILFSNELDFDVKFRFNLDNVQILVKIQVILCYKVVGISNKIR